MSSPDENRDRMLREIERIMRQPYKAPERIRSERYAFLLLELDRFGAMQADLIAKFVEDNGYGTTAQQIRDGAWLQ